MELKFRLEEVLGRDVDLVFKDALKRRLKPIIEKEVLYDYRLSASRVKSYLQGFQPLDGRQLQPIDDAAINGGPREQARLQHG